MFVALDLPDDARLRLSRWRDLLTSGRRDLRPVTAEALHVTLVFLGWQDEAAAPAISEAAFGAAGETAAPVLSPGGVRELPPRNPRLFALDLVDEGGRAGAVAAAVSGALEAGRWYRPEKRPFWPHLTLARVKKGERRVPALTGPPAPGDPFPAGQLTLYRSTLRPQGALYEPLGRATLPYPRIVSYAKDPRVDAYIDPLPGWQQQICKRVRDLVHAADPAVEETIKRRVQPYFVLEGNVCALLAAKDHVNVFLYDGAIVPDPEGIITAGHDNKTARTVAFREGEPINEPALVEMFRQIIANNRAGGWRKIKAARGEA